MMYGLSGLILSGSLTTAFHLSGVNVRDDYRCGENFGGASCVPGQVCNIWGWCQDFNNLLSNPVRSDGRCGPSMGNAPCASGQTCSVWGWCQDEEAPIHVGVRGDARCGPKFNHAPCLPNQSCSQWGWCSETIRPTPAPAKAVPFGRCGPKFNDASCGPHHTCSEWGWCQSQPQKATSSTPTPTLWPTLSVPKPQYPGGAIQQKGVFTTCHQPGMWAFTLDDGPHYTLTPSVLDILREEGVQATFFVVGQMFDIHPNNKIHLRRMYQEGHQIASHSFTHPFLTALSDDAIRQEMQKTNRVIKEVIGKEPIYMRPPFGSHDDRVLRVLNQEGFVAVNWNVVSNDCSLNYVPGGDWELLNNFQAAARLSPNSNSAISLSHDIQDITLRTLRETIRRIKQGGYRLVRIDECLGHAYPAYRS